MKIAMVVWLALVPGALAYAQEQADPPRTFYQRLDAVDDWLTEYPRMGALVRTVGEQDCA